MRKRDALFVEELQRQIGAAGGVVTDAGKIAAIGEAYHFSAHGTPWPAHLALKKARLKLRQADILEALADLYEGAAGFSIVEATRLHVAHIRGTLTRKKRVVLRGGDGKDTVEFVDEQLPPNYAALKDYFGLAVPTQPKRVESKNLNLTVSAPPPREGAPAMRARMIGPSPKMRTIVQKKAPEPEDDEEHD